MVVFVERLDRRARGWLTRVIEASEGRDAVAVVTALDGEGAGVRVLVPEGAAVGTFGDPALTAAAVELGRRALEAETPELVASGGVRLYAEPFGPPPALIVVGAGHVGKALSALAHGLGVSVTVVDDRPEYASRERFPEADRVVAAPVGEALGWLPIGATSAIVVAMRNQDLDYEATASALRTPARYVGLMGARRKAILITERLVADGIPDRAHPGAPGADRTRHRRSSAGGDRRLDPRRMAHGPTGRHGQRPAPRRAALREGRGARRLHLASTRPRCSAVPQVAPLPLPLRNRLAELILEAFEPGEARATVLALARASGEDGCAVEADDGKRLLELGWFESLPGGRVRLRGAHRAHGPDLAERASRAASVIRDWRDRHGEGLAALLDRAAALANHGLFFEVHELLEPVWFRAAEPDRTALQGLIQVAVAFHHVENGNLEGARSLLALGIAKLAGAGAALPASMRARGSGSCGRRWPRSRRASACRRRRAGRRPRDVVLNGRGREHEEGKWRSC